MKIGYITGDFPPLGYAGAIRSYSMVRVFISSGHSVSVFTQKISNNNIENNIVKSRINLASNKSSFFTRAFKEIVFGLEKSFQIIRSSKFDFVIISSPPFLSAIIISLFCTLKKQSYVLDIKDIYPDVFFYQGLSKKKSLIGGLLSYLEKKMYAKSYLISTATDGINKIISKRTQIDIITVRNGYNEENFYPFESKKSKFTVINHGKLGYAQNIKLLKEIIQSFAGLNEYHFIVVGSGKFSETISNLEQENLTYYDYLDISSLSSLIRQCHVGLSLRDNTLIGRTAIPVRVYEYIGSGIPIIVTPKSEAGDIIEEIDAGYQFENSELFDIVNIIKKLNNNRELYKAKVNNLKKNRHFFIQKAQNQKLIEVLNKKYKQTIS